MATKPQALIIGAGIAGLSAAWWLDKAGWSCVLVEKAESPRDGGYIVSLSGACRGTIDRMGLRHELDEISYKFNENVIYNNHASEILRLRYEDVHGGLGTLALCRDDLAHKLARALPDSAEIWFNETLEHVQDHGDKISAILRGGKSVEADLLIGADGVRSSIRDRFWKDVDCLEHLGYNYGVYDIQGANEIDHDCISYNNPGFLDVLYRLRDNRLAALHVWRDNNVTTWDRQGRFKTLRNAAPGRVQLVREFMDHAEQAGCTPIIDSLTMVSLQSWSKGRILLLGDAAHCLTLMSGQGAGMAILSAEILGKELMATKDIALALANHDRKLRPVINRLQGRTQSLASMYIPKSRRVYRLRNLLLKIMPHSWIVTWFSQSTKAEIDLTEA